MRINDLRVTEGIEFCWVCLGWGCWNDVADIWFKLICSFCAFVTDSVKYLKTFFLKNIF